MPIGKYFGRARQSFLFWVGFFFFFLLSLQLLRWMLNPPWTSGEVPGHRSDIPGRQRNAQLCIISGCTCCYGTAGDQNTKTQGRKEKKSKVRTCQGRRFPVKAPPVSAAQHRTVTLCSGASLSEASWGLLPASPIGAVCRAHKQEGI